MFRRGQGSAAIGKLHQVPQVVVEVFEYGDGSVGLLGGRQPKFIKFTLSRDFQSAEPLLPQTMGVLASHARRGGGVLLSSGRVEHKGGAVGKNFLID